VTSPGVRGVEHIGITVPDLDAATRFFVDALEAVPVYDMSDIGEDVFAGADFTPSLGVPQGTRLRNVRFLRFPHGPTLELFHYEPPDQRPAHRPSDIGVQHIALFVDDIDAAGARILAAGGELLEGPSPMVFKEAGDGNRWWYTRTPWGTTIELVSYRTMAYEATTGERRYTPPPIPPA